MSAPIVFPPSLTTLPSYLGSHSFASGLDTSFDLSSFGDQWMKMSSLALSAPALLPDITLPVSVTLAWSAIACTKPDGVPS
jgi:hypothetical protein